MQERLQSLIEKSRKESNDTSKTLSDGQKYFTYLLKRYLCDEQFEKATFEKLTGLTKNAYYKLSGYSKEGRETCKPVDEKTLLKAAYGLGCIYEEALVLFTFFGKNLLCDYPYMQKINSVLLGLDTKEVKRIKPEERKDKLEDMLQKEKL